MSRALRLLVWGMRHVVKPSLTRTDEVTGARRGLELSAIGFYAPRGMRWRKSAEMWRVAPKSGGSRQVMLYFHGGGYIAGSPWTHRGLLGRLARATGAEVVAPRYPLAPEHPAPAAFDHGMAVFAKLMSEGVSAHEVILAGDSAGGGLAAALADALTRQGVGFAGLVLLSPWTDLTLSGPSIAENAAREPLLPLARVREVAAEVCGALAPEDVRLSPLFGSGKNPPPTLIFVGSTEILLDDSRRLAASLRSRGGKVDLVVEPGAPHVYPYLAPYVPEARQAIARIGAFTRALSRRPQV
jgi:epsilon-lactone hydrolase